MSDGALSFEAVDAMKLSSKPLFTQFLSVGGRDGSLKVRGIVEKRGPRPSADS